MADIVGVLEEHAPSIEEILVLVRVDVNNAPDDWESLVGIGVQINQAHDTDRWALGDICEHKIARKYGDAAVKQYADAIGVARSTMGQYWEVSRFYPKPVRERYFERFKTLTWSHYYQCQRTGDGPAAESILQASDDNSWAARSGTKREVDKFLKKPPTAKKLEVIEGTAEYIASRLTQIASDGQYPGLLKAVLYEQPQYNPDQDEAQQDDGE